MKHLNLLACIAAVVWLLAKGLGQSLGIAALESGVGIPPRDLQTWLWWASTLPVFAVHFGIAVWIQDRAVDDGCRRPTLWGLFGLCFGGIAMAIYVGSTLWQRIPAEDR